MKIECLLEEYELMIHHVLKEYQIYPNRHDYEDFAQELRLHLFEELKRLLTSKHQVENMEAYLRHAMRWRLFKLLRQQKRHQWVPVEETFLINQTQEDANLVFKEFVLSLPNTLTPREQEFLQYLYEGYHLTQLAEIYHREYRTIRRWRDRLIEKLKRED
ncbi:sigma-70 family RNA polymerase sigma factor [Globicatella sulfidifaciens]|uniref:sigma-70 family RNA polymerase sigma factor n=1 Tax=Globicatella sulfidifaciens TaxID=136093 RepID=UPI00288F444A|nr:sigma-70 family RNA polymerase sigma factor [Globicatella sulfidifaciens]MDT2767577.1 sigma-70 family RNA polymerase sigma factor [Globicatella sulfidifaciens]